MFCFQICGPKVDIHGPDNLKCFIKLPNSTKKIDLSAYAHLPEGPVRTSAIVKIMRAAEMDYRKPIRHGIMGLPGYVQFTSPIRRYMDLLAHYQVCFRDKLVPYMLSEDSIV